MPQGFTMRGFVFIIAAMMRSVRIKVNFGQAIVFSFLFIINFGNYLNAQTNCSPASQSSEGIDQLEDIRNFISNYADDRAGVMRVHDKGDFICLSLGEDICEEQLTQAEAYVAKVDAFMTSAFHRPRSLYLLLQEPNPKDDEREGRNGSDPLVGLHILAHLPYPIEESSKGWASILIHEYAHQYFIENAYRRVRFEDGSLAYDILKKRNEVAFRDQLGARRLKMAILREGQSERDRPALGEELQSLEDKDHDSDEGLRLRQQWHNSQSKLIRAANELFADTVAVILLDDPAIITKGMMGLLPEEARTGSLMAVIEARRFDQPPMSVEDQRKRSIFLRFSGVHTALSHTRFHIWTFHLSRTKTDDGKRKILQGIIEAAIQMETEIQANHEIAHEIDYASLNRRFIQFFEKAMGTDHPLPDIQLHTDSSDPSP